MALKSPTDFHHQLVAKSIHREFHKTTVRISSRVTKPEPQSKGDKNVKQAFFLSI